MSITDEQFSVVLALARCGIAIDNPSKEYIHQMRRLAKVLPLDMRAKIQEILDWHDSGRTSTNSYAILSNEEINKSLQMKSNHKD